MDEQYKIQLGVELNDAQLSLVKKTLESIETQKREVIYDVDFNIKNANKLVEVGKEIEKIKTQLNGLNDAGSKGKGISPISIDSESLNTSLKNIHDSIKKVQNAFGKVDSKKGIQSLLTSVNHISKAVEKLVSKFDALNKSLGALSNKDLSFNFDFGNLNKKSPEQMMQQFNLLRKEAEEYERYFSKIYASQNVGGDEKIGSIFRLVSETNRGQINYLRGISSMLGNEPTERSVAAYKEYIRLIKESAAIKGADLSIVDARLAENSSFVKAQSEINETKKQLQELFSGGINAEELHRTLNLISNDLTEIKNALMGVSSEAETPIQQLTQSFNRLSDAITEFASNANSVKQTLGDGLSSSVSDSNTEQSIQKQKELAQASAQTANIVVQSEEKKQQAFRETVNEAKQLNNVSINISDGNIDELKNALRNLKLDDDSIEGITRELNEMNIAAKNVSGTFKDGVFKLDIQGVQTMTDGLERAATITKTFGAEGIASSEKYSQSLNRVAIEAEKVVQKLKGEKGHTKFDVEISDAETKFSKLSNQSEDLQAKIKLLKQEFTNIQNASDKGDNNEIVAANERYLAILRDINNQLKLNKQEEQRANNDNALEIQKQNALLRLKSLFGENSEAARKFGAEVDKLQREINECGSLTGIPNLNQQITNLGLKVKEASVQTQTFGQRLKKQWQQYSAYFSIASLVSYATQGLRDMFEQVKLIDSAMTELKKVTDETDASYNKFLSNAAKRSKEIGTTIDGLVSSTADFARLGYGFKDAQGLAEVANIYAVVGDEIEGVEGATESLISTMAAFKDEMNGMSNTDFAMSIIDKFNEIGNNFAISSGGIGEALERSASSLMAANNTIDESIALITAANTVVVLCHAA